MLFHFKQCTFWVNHNLGQNHLNSYLLIMHFFSNIFLCNNCCKCENLIELLILRCLSTMQSYCTDHTQSYFTGVLIIQCNDICPVDLNKLWMNAVPPSVRPIFVVSQSYCNDRQVCFYYSYFEENFGQMFSHTSLFSTKSIYSS